MSLADLAHLIEQPEWMADAACRHLDSDLFFPRRHGYAGSGKQAKAVCAGCPVVDDCLEYALAWPSGYDYGIYAGTNSEDRRQMRRQRRVA
jgi:WhiB family transcriptional regulator, redox-sensing transcriptional regulator